MSGRTATTLNNRNESTLFNLRGFPSLSALVHLGDLHISLFKK